MMFIEELAWSSDSAWVQFSGKVQSLPRAIYRIEPMRGEAKRIVDSAAFCCWLGIGPNREVVGFRQPEGEIYAFDWQVRLTHP
jgi:hypothetical protein